jgi:hypothetical protein
MNTEEDDEFKRIERESGWRKRQIMAEDDDDIQDYKKPWVGLTDDEVYKIAFALEGEHWRKIADAIEAKLKEKNT